MAFLIPAVIALVCDGAVLSLHRMGRHQDDHDDESNPDSTTTQVYFWVGNYYLVPLAVCRMAALVGPFLFHSYTGTAVRFPKLYQALYGMTAVLVTIHMMGLLLLNPQSLESILPLELVSSFGTSNNNNHHDTNDNPDSHNETTLLTVRSLLFQQSPLEEWHSSYQDDHAHRLLLQHLHALRRVWWMLVFSAVSTACHLAVLNHVTSTAPSWRDVHPKHHRPRQPQSVYFALRSRRKRHEQVLQRRRQRQRQAAAAAGSDPETGHEWDHPLSDDYDDDEEWDDGSDNDEEEPALVHAVNEFLVDVQGRLRRAKQEWSKRLDDFARHRMPESASISAAAAATTSSSPAPSRSLWNNHNNHHYSHHHNHPHNPFRVLLQLFAEQEDVFDNGLLSAAFEWDEGQSLTFLVPQLLSFLLHGATTSSERLEDWILQQCRTNIRFAHKCYWFLRAWCLEVPSNGGTGASGSSGGPQTFLSMSRENSGSQLSALDSTAELESSSMYLDQPAVSERPPTTTGTTTVDSSVTSLCRPSGDAATTTAAAAAAADNDKFMPQERAMIERLMLRVKECGESAVRSLEFHNNHNTTLSSWSSSTTSSSSANTSFGTRHLVERGAIPMDPMTGRPSQRHLENMTAPPAWGFRPRTRPTTTTTDHSTASGSGDSTEQFDKTPQFLDALIYIAEVLFTVPRETRKDELHNLLRQLECELLPDNAVYVPGHSSLGRVWRVAVPECIPISTKERVPCIVALEVVHWPTQDTTSIGNNSRTGNGSNTIANGGVGGGVTSPSTPDGTTTETSSSWSLLDFPKRFSLSERTDSGDRSGSGRPSWTAEAILSNPGSLRHMVSSSDPNHGARRTADETTAAAGDGGTTTTTTTGTARTKYPSPNTSTLMDYSTATASSLFPHPLRSTSASSPHLPSHNHHHHMSEAELVLDWRHRPRNPLRLVPLINRVGETMKGTMDRVKTTMQERFNDLRDRDHAVNEELQSLTQIQGTSSTMNDEDDDLQDDTNHDEDIGVGGGVGLDQEYNVGLGVINGTPQSLDPRSSLDNARSSNHHNGGGDRLAPPPPPPPPPPMGQWSSPAIGSATHRKRAPSASPASSTSSSNTTTLRHRSSKLDGHSSHKRRKSAGNGIALPYGSGDDNDKSRRHGGGGGDASMPSSTSVVMGGLETTTTTSVAAAAAAAAASLKPPPVVFRESWHVKQERIRQTSAYGSHPGWRLAPILIKANDDLRQEELASQLIYRMASILAREKVPVWLCPYEIIALTDRAGLIEAIPDTISIDSLKRNDPNFTNLRNFFMDHYGEGTEELSDAKANFVESLAAYSMVCFLLQIKDRHNGNILIDSRGHVIHIDFGFFFLSSPGKNAGFESAPFKLTRDFMQVMDGPHSHLFHVFRELCVRSFLALRKHCMEIIVLVEMIQAGNEQLPCFRGRPDRAIAALRERFRLDLNDRACREYVHSLVDDSMENWRTDWYDRYQKYFVGVL